MDAEFINMYVQKQKDAMVDLLTQNVMLETRIAIAEKKISAQIDEIEKLKVVESQMEEMRKDLLHMQQENLNIKKMYKSQENQEP